MLYVINKTIKLFEHSDATLTTYVLDDGEYETKNTVRPAVLICPGGGYTMISRNEGEPVAIAYAQRGYHAFVLTYSVKIDNPFPTALKELAKAMSIIRENAVDWLVDKDNIAVVGFSAGGNLALSLGIYHQEDFLTKDLQLPIEQIKPNHLILGYPAVTLQLRNSETPAYVIELMEKGLIPDMRGPSIHEILLGKENPTEEEKASLNLLNYIHDRVPRTFIWGTYEDTLIPPTDLWQLGMKLYEFQVPSELHLFEKGPHGMSICTDAVKPAEQIEGLSIPQWFDLSIKWLKQGNRQ